MRKLKGKKVLITGAASGIGYHTAVSFAKEGSVLVLTDINEEGLKQAASEIEGFGVMVHTYVNDVSDLEAVQKLADDVIGKLGGIDVLVNNAGIGFSAEIKDTTMEDWKRLIGINVWGPIHFVTAFLPSMISQRKGAIVNISSGQAFFPVPTWGAYAATKFFLAGYSEALHYEVAQHGITVTTVFPFLVDSPFYSDIKADTIGSKMVLKMIPFIAASPEGTGRTIVNAVKKGKKNELHHLFNKLGFRLTRLVPFAFDGAGHATALAMTMKKD